MYTPKYISKKNIKYTPRYINNDQNKKSLTQDKEINSQYDVLVELFVNPANIHNREVLLTCFNINNVKGNYNSVKGVYETPIFQYMDENRKYCIFKEDFVWELPINPYSYKMYPIDIYEELCKITGNPIDMDIYDNVQEEYENVCIENIIENGIVLKLSKETNEWLEATYDYFPYKDAIKFQRIDPYIVFELSRLRHRKIYTFYRGLQFPTLNSSQSTFPDEFLNSIYDNTYYIDINFPISVSEELYIARKYAKMDDDNVKGLKIISKTNIDYRDILVDYNVFNEYTPRRNNGIIAIDSDFGRKTQLEARLVPGLYRMDIVEIKSTDPFQEYLNLLNSNHYKEFNKFKNYIDSHNLTDNVNITNITFNSKENAIVVKYNIGKEKYLVYFNYNKTFNLFHNSSLLDSYLPHKDSRKFSGVYDYESMRSGKFYNFAAREYYKLHIESTILSFEKIKRVLHGLKGYNVIDFKENINNSYVHITLRDSKYNLHMYLDLELNKSKYRVTSKLLANDVRGVYNVEDEFTSNFYYRIFTDLINKNKQLLDSKVYKIKKNFRITSYIKESTGYIPEFEISSISNRNVPMLRIFINYLNNMIPFFLYEDGILQFKNKDGILSPEIPYNMDQVNDINFFINILEHL